MKRSEPPSRKRSEGEREMRREILSVAIDERLAGNVRLNGAMHT